MLQWSEKFQTGHAEIDSQHQMLIDHINQLEVLSYNTNPDRHEAESLLNFVDFVENYTLIHFAHEENCMARHRCPVHQQNMDAHREFSKYFRAFKLRFSAEGCRPEVLKELHDACSAWVQAHILKIDHQLKPYLSASPEESK